MSKVMFCVILKVCMCPEWECMHYERVENQLKICDSRRWKCCEMHFQQLIVLMLMINCFKFFPNAMQ